MECGEDGDISPLKSKEKAPHLHSSSYNCVDVNWVRQGLNIPLQLSMYLLAVTKPPHSGPSVCSILRVLVNLRAAWEQVEI